MRARANGPKELATWPLVAHGSKFAEGDVALGDCLREFTDGTECHGDILAEVALPDAGPDRNELGPHSDVVAQLAKEHHADRDCPVTRQDGERVLPGIEVPVHRVVGLVN